MDALAATKMHDDLLALRPEGARHDQDICPFCVEKAAASTTSDPSGSGRPDVSSTETQSTEGGTNPPMNDISQAAHEALLKSAVAEAVAEATKATETALANKTEEASTKGARVTELEAELASVKADNDRLNKELDSAQVKLTSATEEVASLKETITKAEEAAQLAEVASKRAEQVKNLKLFPDEYVSEKASKWAAFDEASWTDQLEEWKQLKPEAVADGTQSDAASAMTGTTEQLTKEQQDAAAAAGGTGDKPKARRAALGLV